MFAINDVLQLILIIISYDQTYSYVVIFCSNLTAEYLTASYRPLVFAQGKSLGLRGCEVLVLAPAQEAHHFVYSIVEKLSCLVEGTSIRQQHIERTAWQTHPEYIWCRVCTLFVTIQWTVKIIQVKL